jgi:hypothetical protein
MISGFSVSQAYLAIGFTDMRKSINGLSLIVSEQLGHDPAILCNQFISKSHIDQKEDRNIPLDENQRT